MGCERRPSGGSGWSQADSRSLEYSSRGPRSVAAIDASLGGAFTIDPLRHTLAIHGGAAAVPQGPPAWPLADDEVRAALERAFADGSWGRYHGPHGDALAEALARQFACPHVALCCSGTFAVQLALRGLGVAPGDEVVLAGYDYPGNFRSVEALGAVPVLVDVDPRTASLDPAGIADAVSPLTRAIVVSHLHGALAPMPDVVHLAAGYGLGVVEDGCQATGAMVAGRPVGAWGDVGVLSFGGSKLLTAGRGGAIVTRRADVHQRAKIFSEQGNSAYPLSELQAAVLLPQVARLAARNAIRGDNVRRLLGQLSDVRGLRPLAGNVVEGEPSYYKLGWMLEGGSPAGQREPLVAALQAEGVAIDVGFRGLARRSARRCRHVGELAASRAAAERMLVLHHPVLLEPPAVIDQVAVAVRKVLGALGA